MVPDHGVPINNRQFMAGTWQLDDLSSFCLVAEWSQLPERSRLIICSQWPEEAMEEGTTELDSNEWLAGRQVAEISAGLELRVKQSNPSLVVSNQNL